MRIFIISNRLPIKIVKNETNEFRLIKSEGGLATGLDSLNIPNIEMHWIGWPGMEVKEPKVRNKLNKILKKDNYHPVYLSEKQINEYYEGYSNSILWPLFHYFYSFMEYDNRNWLAYKLVNEKFYEEAGKIIKSGDI